MHQSAIGNASTYQIPLRGTHHAKWNDVQFKIRVVHARMLPVR